MVNFEFVIACAWILDGQGVWDEWSVVMRLFLSLGKSWKRFG